MGARQRRTGAIEDLCGPSSRRHWTTGGEKDWPTSTAAAAAEEDGDRSKLVGASAADTTRRHSSRASLGKYMARKWKLFYAAAAVGRGSLYGEEKKRRGEVKLISF